MPNKKEKDQKVQWIGKQPTIKRIFHVTIQTQSCLKCLRLIEVIHRLNKSVNGIESHHQSDFNLLRNTTKLAISDMLEIMISLK